MAAILFRLQCANDERLKVVGVYTYVDTYWTFETETSCFVNTNNTFSNLTWVI